MEQYGESPATAKELVDLALAVKAERAEEQRRLDTSPTLFDHID